jgi:hypothetical protein
MSHQVTISLEIRDIEAVKAVCREKGWAFLEGQRQYNDPFNTNVPCDHAIRLVGNNYGSMWKDTELGLIRNPNGGYRLACDAMLLRKDRLGENGSHFMQLYGVHKATLEAKRLGYQVQRQTLKNGNIQLAVIGAF